MTSERARSSLYLRVGSCAGLYDGEDFQLLPLIDTDPLTRWRRISGLHSACFRVCVSPIPPTLFAATKYRFEPADIESHEMQRFERIKRVLVPLLYDRLPIPKLPNELLRIIAGYLAREYAAITGQRQTVEGGVSDMIEVALSPSHDVYAQYHRIDGIRYVRTLRKLKTRAGRVAAPLRRTRGANCYLHRHYCGRSSRHPTSSPDLVRCRAALTDRPYDWNLVEGYSDSGSIRHHHVERG